MAIKLPWGIILAIKNKGNSKMGNKVKQQGMGHQVGIGNNSPVIRNVNILTKTKYFFSGVIVSIVAAIIFEFFLKGKISAILIKLTTL